MQCFSVFIDANWWLVNPHLQYRMQWSKGMLSKTALESTDSCPSFVSSQEGNRTYILPVSQETRDPSPWKAVAFEGVYRKCWPFLHKCEVKKKKVLQTYSGTAETYQKERFCTLRLCNMESFSSLHTKPCIFLFKWLLFSYFSDFYDNQIRSSSCRNTENSKRLSNL